MGSRLLGCLVQDLEGKKWGKTGWTHRGEESESSGAPLSNMGRCRNVSIYIKMYI